MKMFASVAVTVVTAVPFSARLMAAVAKAPLELMIGALFTNSDVK